VSERGTHLEEKCEFKIRCTMRSKHAVRSNKKVGHGAVGDMVGYHTVIASHWTRTLVVQRKSDISTQHNNTMLYRCKRMVIATFPCEGIHGLVSGFSAPRELAVLRPSKAATVA
jgi:hypothetical protein